MNSEDWKTVLLAFIGFLTSATTVGGGILGTYLMIRLKSIQKDQTATKSLINGRMDEIKRQERAAGYAEGHAAGVALTCKSFGERPNVPIGQKELAEAVADTVTAPAKENK